jgi:hypothetical protein
MQNTTGARGTELPSPLFLPSFGSFRQAVSEEKIFKNQQYLYRDNCILNTDIYI